MVGRMRWIGWNTLRIFNFLLLPFMIGTLSISSDGGKTYMEVGKIHNVTITPKPVAPNWCTRCDAQIHYPKKSKMVGRCKCGIYKVDPRTCQVISYRERTDPMGLAVLSSIRYDKQQARQKGTNGALKSLYLFL